MNQINNKDLYKLDKDVFTKGLQLICSILTDNASKSFYSREKNSSYYLLLSDIPSEIFLDGVMDFCRKWHNTSFVPSPGEIRAGILERFYCGYSKEEFINLLKTKKMTNVKYSNDLLEKNLNFTIMNNIDINKISYQESESNLASLPNNFS